MNQEPNHADCHDISPDEQAFLDQEYGNRPRIEDAERCRLPASGFTETLSPVYDWARAIVSDFKAKANGQRIHANLWAYREQNSEWLALDLFGGIDGDLTFLIGEPHNYSLDSPGTVIQAPDMTEAIHMAGIICDALDVDVRVGCRINEVNSYCTPDQWGPNQTNAPLKIVSQATDEGLSK